MNIFFCAKNFKTFYQRYQVSARYCESSYELVFLRFLLDKVVSYMHNTYIDKIIAKHVFGNNI